MGAAQLRHFKLWFAGRLQNWELAGYEVDQIRKSFEVASLYNRKLGDQDIAGKIKIDSYPPLDALKSAVESHDSPRFTVEFEKLTAACNACHEATHFGFIQIRVPTASPFSDQLFSPPEK